MVFIKGMIVEKVSIVKRRKRVASDPGRDCLPGNGIQVLKEQETNDGAFYIDEMDLKQVYLLKGVEPEVIIGLLDLCTILKLEPQEVLIVPTQSNRTVYFLLAGRLRIHLDSVDSKPIVMLDPGESVGEMSVVDHKPTSAFVVADESCVLLAMEEDTLWSLVQASHAAARNLLFTLVQRLRHADAIISDNMVRGVKTP
ncbi:MAG TPA: Crp/Fnr family transcriptional regulator [Syntrophales bacterium]|nr:Crp/Fnr family transcriptional regulator [Syntrophales bacterium]